MKQFPAAVLFSLGCLLSISALPAADDKITADKAKQLLEKGLGELSKAANKSDKDKDSKTGIWERSKETLKLSREDYMKKVQSAFASMEAEIQVMAEGGSTIPTRDYFKTRLESLRQQLDYSRRDSDRLKDIPTEEAFRVKQRGFDRTLGFLSDNIELARDEAGL